MPNLSSYNLELWKEFLQKLPDNIKDTVTQLLNPIQDKFRYASQVQKIFLSHSDLISDQIRLIPSSSRDQLKELRSYLSVFIEQVSQNNLSPREIEQDIVSIRAHLKLKSFWDALFIRAPSVFSRISLKGGWEKGASFFYQQQVTHNCQHHQNSLVKQENIHRGDISKIQVQWFYRIIPCYYEMKNSKGLVQVYRTIQRELPLDVIKMILLYLSKLRSVEGILEVYQIERTQRKLPLEVIDRILLYLYELGSVESILEVYQIERTQRKLPL